MKKVFAAALLLGAAYSLRADTIIFKNDDELEGKILERDEVTIKVEVEFGTLLVPMSKVKRIDPDTPEKVAERERKKAEAKELAERMKDEGKVKYKGKWVTEDEKKADEDKVAELKKKKAEEAKKKAEEEEKKRAAQEALYAQQQQQLNQQNQEDYNSRGGRFARRHGRDDNYDQSRNNNYNNSQYGGNNTQTYSGQNYQWSNQMGGGRYGR